MDRARLEWEMNLDTSGGAALGLLAALHIAASRGGNSKSAPRREPRQERQPTEIELWNLEVDARKTAKKRGGV